MVILSLFNGMSTGHTALDNVGIKVDKYYSSEIKPHAIKLTQHHYPDTIQLGDVTRWKDWDIDYSSIDMVLSGSPCQDLSIAGKRAGLEGNRSSLFWVFVDILNHIKGLNPDVLFLQENVGSAPKGDVGIMSRALGVYPVRINSSLVTAQLRDRYYWSNIKTRQDGLFGDMVTDIPQPKDRKIIFKDIIQGGAVRVQKATALLEGCWKQHIKDKVKQDKYLRNVIKKGFQTPPLVFVDKDKHNCLMEHYIDANTNKNDEYFNGFQEYIVNRPNGMATIIVDQNKMIRLVNKVEMCRLQGFPDDWCDILSYREAGSLLGDGWTLPIIEHIFSYIKENK